MAELDGLRVLLVEDELLVAMMLEETLHDAGCVVIGPVGRVDKAMDAAEGEAIDVAVLDVNLGGERVYPVAETLARMGVPFVFMTGYDRGVLPAEYAGRPAMRKPFKPAELIRQLATMLETHRVG